MKIEFLYFDDCPGHKTALALLEQILREEGISESIEKIEVTTEEAALQNRFLGSPSIRINGRDIEGRAEESEYGLKCRIYPDTGTGIPSQTTIRAALQSNQ